MAVISYDAPGSLTTHLTTELNTLGIGYTHAVVADGSAIDNTTGLYLFMSLELYLASVNPGAGSYITTSLIPAVDTTTANFADTAGAGTTSPPVEYQCAYMTPIVSSSVKRMTATNIPIPPLRFKLQVFNKMTVAFASSGNTLKYRLHNYKVV
jgi:hypothetical protein